MNLKMLVFVRHRMIDKDLDFWLSMILINYVITRWYVWIFTRFTARLEYNVRFLKWIWTSHMLFWYLELLGCRTLGRVSNACMGVNALQRNLIGNLNLKDFLSIFNFSYSNVLSWSRTIVRVFKTEITHDTVLHTRVTQYASPYHWTMGNVLCG
jgi:hypothetical protein